MTRWMRWSGNGLTTMGDLVETKEPYFLNPHDVGMSLSPIPRTYSNCTVLLHVWWRAFSIVSVTALNVVMVSGGYYRAAFWTGGLLSFIWWSNTRTASACEVRGSQLAYAFGAGCGTVTGMVLGMLWRRWHV